MPDSPIQEGERVWWKLTAWLYLDAPRFDNWSCFVVHSLYTKPHYTYHMGASCRTVPFVAMHWSCSVGLLYKHCHTMNIPAVQLANTTFTRLFLPLWVSESGAQNYNIVQGYKTPETLLMKGALAKFSKEELFFSTMVMISPTIDFTSTDKISGTLRCCWI